MTRSEMVETIELLERLRELGTLWFEQLEPDPVMNMSLHVMKRHLIGQPVTPTSLAQMAGVPYTTATRRVNAMLETGLLDARPRTRSGRTFWLHPSPALISSMTSYLQGIRTAISQTQSFEGHIAPPADADTIIPPPSLQRHGGEFGAGLSILVPDDPAYSIGQRLRRELSYLSGGRIRFSGASIDDLGARVAENARRPVSEYDVVAVDLPRIAEFAANNVLTPLDTVAAQDRLNSADFNSAAWRGTIYDDSQYAIPILINPQLLFYRSDIIEKNGLTPPTDTDQLLAIARQLHNPQDGTYGVSWTAARGGPAGQAFVQFLADHGQPIFDLEPSVDGFKTSNISSREIRPKIATDRGRITAQFMFDLLDVSPPEVLQFGWGGQVRLLREGRVAMAYEWASRAAQLVSDKPVRALKFLPHPVGLVDGTSEGRDSIAPIGGFAFGIPANIEPSRMRVAWNVIKWLAAPEIIKLLVQHGGYVTPRNSVAQDPDVRRISPMIAAVDAMARKGQIRLWPRPPVTSHASLVDIIGEEIHDMLVGKRGISEALGRAQDRAEALYRDG